MKLLTILALLIAIVPVVFATQNAAPVAIHFLGWSYEASMENLGVGAEISSQQSCSTRRTATV
ncbi:hypothetical protein [Phormidesmis priestleyi]|uniref:hypothetical protein n=1 Tax=Phormidesmis priestleyi TaxID=268141 RepID=UPI00083A0E49|nr:hypothetical protein [Phormidesmis priestleyi]